MLYGIILNSFISISADSMVTFADSLREDIVVQAFKASETTPVTQTNLTKNDIKAIYYGQDIGYVLEKTPSVTAQSDAGNPMGYTFFRLRGIDYTRINFNINGIPVNDPENQGFFSNNFADLASSAKSVQIQRGIGTTQNGTAPIAGAINITTHDLGTPRFAQATLGYGMYNSGRITVEYNTGIVGHKALYIRLSQLSSDGYRAHSATDLKTYFVSTGYFWKKHILKLNLFGGYTQNQLAYMPADKATLEQDIRYNPLGNRANDAFSQHFMQLQHTYFHNDKITITSSIYYVKGWAPRFAIDAPGWFDYNYYNLPNPTMADGTMAMYPNAYISYRLNQNLAGAMSSWNYTGYKYKITVGVHTNVFISDHFMDVLDINPAASGFAEGHKAYFNTGYKNEVSSFVKQEFILAQGFSLTTDFQSRFTTFLYKGQDKIYARDTFEVEPMRWFFFNPKIGLRYQLTDVQAVYISGGMVSREPTRYDYLLDDRAIADVKQSSLQPESVFNLEMGYQLKSKIINLNANLYAMEFSNEIAATGELNAFGYAVRKNTGQSYRRGLETEITVRLSKIWSLTHSSALSTNSIKRFAQTLPVDSMGTMIGRSEALYENVNPVLTPTAIVNQGILMQPTKYWWTNLAVRYVNKMYLSVSNDEALTTPAYTTIDMSTTLHSKDMFPKLQMYITLAVNNIADVTYYTAGTPYEYFIKNPDLTLTRTGSPSYFVGMPKNFFITLGIKY
ncbi:MAG: TonB-dependent receptor [Cytophagales bacterium]|nr:TonB-dependent receptor [Cytophagales bacterium]